MTEIKRADVETALREARAMAGIYEAGDSLTGCRVTIALCEQWLADRRVRWAPGDWSPASADLSGGGFAGHVYRFDDGTWEAGIDSVPQMMFMTEAEAREWVEARAIAEGYEIAREP